VTLAAFDGPGRVTHVWMTIERMGPVPLPVALRAQRLEVTYDGRPEPSVSAPVPDLFGAVHGVTAPYASAMTAANEGRGFTSRVPMPFRRSVVIDYVNDAEVPVVLYYQVDVLLGPVGDDLGYLHAAFRRDNPTVEGHDFTIAEGFRGPGRLLGWTGGVRVLDPAHWWGEGEVKVYFDGESTATICGTGTEDHLDSSWGLGQFAAPESGAPLVFGDGDRGRGHRLVSFYRWHLSDPVVFERSARVTVQQIGGAVFPLGAEEAYREFRDRVTSAGTGWLEGVLPGTAAFGLYERSDDWCATAFVYCAEPQPVERYDAALATADLDVAVEAVRTSS
jgi:hypothetical protein